MIDYQQYCQIKDCHENQHLTAAQIAREFEDWPGTCAGVGHGGHLGKTDGPQARCNSEEIG